MEKTNISIKEMSNKSRKGTYLYIRQKGKRPAYYKWDGKTPIDAYINYYEIKNSKRIKTKPKLKEVVKAFTIEEGQKQDKILRRYIKGIEKRGGKISKSIRRGKTISKTYDLLTAGMTRTKIVYRQLLKPLVYDKGLLELVIRNAHKIKHRFQHELEFIGEKGERLGWVRETGMTVEAVIEKYKSQVGKYTKIGYMTLKRINKNTKYEREGTLIGIRTVSIFGKDN